MINTTCQSSAVNTGVLRNENPIKRSNPLIIFSYLSGKIIKNETFARKMISLSGKAKTHGMREFMLINDRLSTILTQHAGEMAFVQRSQNTNLLHDPGIVLFEYTCNADTRTSTGTTGIVRNGYLKPFHIRQAVRQLTRGFICLLPRLFRPYALKRLRHPQTYRWSNLRRGAQHHRRFCPPRTSRKFHCRRR